MNSIGFLAVAGMRQKWNKPSQVLVFREKILSIEEKISELEKRIAEADKKMARPEKIEDENFYDEYWTMKKNLDRLMNRWETEHKELEAWKSRKTWYPRYAEYHGY